jgi:hypothetical protein
MNEILQARVDKVVSDNPDLPQDFVRELLFVLSDHKPEATPFYNHLKVEVKNET